MKLSEFALFEAAHQSSGKASAKVGTTRASKIDIEAALRFVSKHTGVPESDLKKNLLGSTSRTLAGLQDDSGDIDIAFKDDGNRDVLIKKMRDATPSDFYNTVGPNISSFAVPVGGGRSVQVDFMFVPSVEWSKFAFNIGMDKDTQYKGIVRVIMLSSLMRYIVEPGKDLVVEDPNGGEDLIRVRRSFKPDTGLVRLFKMRHPRKDGKGVVKALTNATPEQITAQLKAMGKEAKFSTDPDPITSPDAAAKFIFGPGVKAADMQTAEQCVNLIKKHYAKNYEDVMAVLAAEFGKRDIPVPKEFK
jgi:hypothetical protein